MYHGCSWFYLVQMVRDARWYTTARYSTVPFAYWYCGARIVLFSFIETLFVACFVFCDHALEFRKMSQCENILTTVTEDMYEYQYCTSHSRSRCEGWRALSTLGLKSDFHLQRCYKLFGHHTGGAPMYWSMFVQKHVVVPIFRAFSVTCRS